MNRRDLGYMRGCLVNAISLCVALCNQLSLEAINIIIMMKLASINPFTTNKMFASW
jgi:hypothetical protein